MSASAAGIQMSATSRNTLGKSERLHGRNAVDELFQKAKRSSMAVFPLRAVFAVDCDADGSEPQGVRILVSVSKKHFKRAVKRNRCKRQVREAYRKQKHALCQTVDGLPHTRLSVAFIWLADELRPTEEVESSMATLLARIGEKTQRIAHASAGAGEKEA